MNSERFPVDFTFYSESAVQSAIEDFAEVANVRRDGSFLIVETAEDEDPKFVFGELMNYALQFPLS